MAIVYGNSEHQRALEVAFHSLRASDSHQVVIVSVKYFVL